MNKVLIIDSSARDAQRFQNILAREGVEADVCLSGADAEHALESGAEGFAAVFVLWNLPGAVSGFEMLTHCRHLWPELPVVIISDALDATMATRAFALGARDFLEKPLDSERVVSCIRALLAEKDPLSPLVERLRQTILGESPALLAMLEQVAKVIPHTNSRVLLIGESGTGKELIAQAIHDLGPRAGKPLVAVNISAIPSTLIESALFGHEKGAFTGATERHRGYLEESDDGTLFLDEIGDLDLTLQVKLLRVIQENQFRRLRGEQTVLFKARLVCATNRDLATAVNSGDFRRDLFHRIAEVTVQVPPLRERKGDVDMLLDHFIDRYKENCSIRLARETRTILRSYPFLGNVRELENLIRAALIECDGDQILPRHLPLQSMGTLLALNQDTFPPDDSRSKRESHNHQTHKSVIDELVELLPDSWLDLPYREAAQPYQQAFDRIYLQRRLARSRHNVTQAARDAGVDTKTFRKRWKDAGLPPLGAEEEAGE